MAELVAAAFDNVQEADRVLTELSRVSHRPGGRSGSHPPT